MACDKTAKLLKKLRYLISLIDDIKACFFFFFGHLRVFSEFGRGRVFGSKGVEGSLYTIGLKALNLRGKDERCQGSTLPGERGYHNPTNARI